MLVLDIQQITSIHQIVLTKRKRKVQIKFSKLIEK